MSKDATQQGVSDQDQELTEEEKREIEAHGRDLAASTRLNALDAIAAHVDQERVEQDGMVLEPEVVEKKAEKKDLETDRATEDLSEQEEEMVKLVVDGTEQEVPLSKVMDAGKRTLQKETAADKRLEEATSLKKSAEQLLADARKKTGQAPGADDGAGEKPQVKDDEFKAKKKTWIQAIQYGEEAEAEKALDEMMDVMGRGSTTVTSKEDLSTLVKQALDEREQQEVQKGLEKIRSKFNSSKDEGGFDDLAGSPYLMDEVSKLVDERLKDGAPNVWETYEAAGTEIRTRRETAVKPAGKVKVDDLSEKRRRKAGIDNVSGVGAKSTSSKTTDEEVSEEDARASAVREIMQKRGQML